MEQVWLKEGEVIITREQFRYFRHLIEFIYKNNLKTAFNLWVKHKDAR